MFRAMVPLGSGTLDYDLLGDGAACIGPYIGFIFQSGYLLRNASVSANISVALASAGDVVTPARLGAFYHAFDLDAVPAPQGLDVVRARRLSGGEAQRVAIIRALSRDPWIILADEPTASLDERHARDVMERLVGWRDADRRRTLIWVTHDLESAARHADLILIVRKHFPIETKSMLANPGTREALLQLLHDDAALNSAMLPSGPGHAARAGWRSFAARVRFVLHLTSEELFSGAVVDNAERRLPVWLARAASVPERGDEKPRRLTWFPFAKWPEVAIQVTLLLLALLCWQARPLMDDQFSEFLRAANLTHLVVQGRGITLNHMVVKAFTDDLNEPPKIVMLDDGPRTPLNEYDKSRPAFGRNEKLGAFAALETVDSSGSRQCDYANGIPINLLAMDWEEARLQNIRSAPVLLDDATERVLVSKQFLNRLAPDAMTCTRITPGYAASARRPISTRSSASEPSAGRSNRW